MDDWFAGILIAILIAFVVIVIMFAVAEGERTDTCCAAGYTWNRRYAGTYYCVRIEDERLIGVPLATVE